MPPSLAFRDPSLDRLPPTQTFQILSEFERNSAHIYSQVSPPSQTPIGRRSSAAPSKKVTGLSPPKLSP